MIAIIDYNISNVRSVEKAFEHLAFDSVITSEVSVIESAEKIVLPGVGSFKSGMENLHRLGLIDVLCTQILKNKKPFLGICLGMQLLVTKGFENGSWKGLGWIKGECNKLSVKDNKLRLPHMGWNNINVQNNANLFSGMKSSCFYFCHSYRISCDNGTEVLATANYGEEFIASIKQDNIYAVQFHPEKSFDDGFNILKNFAERI